MKTTGLILDLLLQEGSGSTVYDRCRQGNNGTLANSPTWTELDSGKYSIEFDGVDQDIDVGDIGSARTLMFWVKMDAVDQVLVDETGGGANVFVTSGNLSRISWDEGYIDGVAPATEAVSTNVWHHVAVTSTTDVTLSALRFASNSNRAAYGDIHLSDIKVFKQELSAREIRAYYNRTKHLY